MSSSTTQQNKPVAKVQDPVNEDHKKLLNKKRNNNKKVDGINQLIEKFQSTQDKPSAEQTAKIESLKSVQEESKKIEKEIKDFLKSIKDADAKEKAQKRDSEKLVNQGRREAVHAIANMIAIHTFQDCGHSDLVPGELNSGINHFRECINKLTLRTQTDAGSNWKEHRDCFVNQWSKLGSGNGESIPDCDISYADLSKGISESLESGNYPEHVAKQKKERNKKHKKAETEVVQEEVAEEVAEVQEAEPVVEEVAAEVTAEVEVAQAEVAEEEEKETAEEVSPNHENKEERVRDDKRGRGRGNRGRGEHRPRGNYKNRYDGKDEDGFETVKDDKTKQDTRGRGRGRGRGYFNRDGERVEYPRGSRGDRGDRGNWRGGERGDRGDRGGRARPTTSRKGKEFSEGKQVNEATAGESTEAPKE